MITVYVDFSKSATTQLENANTRLFPSIAIPPVFDHKNELD